MRAHFSLLSFPSTIDIQTVLAIRVLTYEEAKMSMARFKTEKRKRKQMQNELLPSRKSPTFVGDSRPSRVRT